MEAVKVNNYKIIEEKIVYVVLRNETRINKKTKEKEEYTQILRVFETEEASHKYVNKLINSVLFDPEKVQIVAIPTPYGDIV